MVAEGTPGATRRSVYLQQRRTQTDSLLEVFDAPSIVTTCTRRSPSTIPLQSLSLLNSDFVTTRARKLAARLESEFAAATAPLAEDDSRITRAFLLDVQPSTGSGRANRRPAIPGGPAMTLRQGRQT